MKLAFVFGTRPELLKLIPVVKALEQRNLGGGRVLRRWKWVSVRFTL